jgi:hypothetical protein
MTKAWIPRSLRNSCWKRIVCNSRFAMHNLCASCYKHKAYNYLAARFRGFPQGYPQAVWISCVDKYGRPPAIKVPSSCKFVGATPCLLNEAFGFQLNSDQKASNSPDQVSLCQPVERCFEMRRQNAGDKSAWYCSCMKQLGPRHIKIPQTGSLEIKN